MLTNTSFKILIGTLLLILSFCCGIFVGLRQPNSELRGDVKIPQASRPTLDAGPDALFTPATPEKSFSEEELRQVCDPESESCLIPQSFPDSDKYKCVYGENGYCWLIENPLVIAVPAKQICNIIKCFDKDQVEGTW